MGELGSSDVAEIMSKNDGTGAEGLNSRRMRHNFHTLHRKVPVYGPSCTARDWHRLPESAVDGDCGRRCQKQR